MELSDFDVQVLTRIEWVFDWESGEDLCPECENNEYQGHREGCGLAALLKKLIPADWQEARLASGADRKSEESIRRALEETKFNGAAAAKLLGIPIRSFRRYCKAFGIRKKFA